MPNGGAGAQLAPPLNPAPHKQGETSRDFIRDLHRRPA
nr:MAG TPA: hypothetical protein [Caudoviricetes sp.]